MSEPSVLHHALVRAPDASPDRWALLLHGVFGMGANFRGFAQRLAALVPDWGFVLVDLRGHGQSQGMPPPHDLAAAGRDLDALIERLGLRVEGIAGHSFGGKVALAWLADRPGAVSHAVVLDSMPGARPSDAAVDTASRVLESLERMPAELVSREEFRARLEGEGYERAIVDWLAMNLRREGERLSLRLDLPAIRAMLLDYYARDLWGALDDPALAAHALLVIGGRSPVFPPEARARAALSAERNPHLRVEVIEGAGHWVHVDAPDALATSLSEFLRAPR